MRNFMSRPIRVKILDTTSTKLFPGQVAICVFDIHENNLGGRNAQRFYLAEEGSPRSFYASGTFFGEVLASAFEPNVWGVRTAGNTLHHIQVLENWSDLGFKPKVVAPEPGGSW